MLRPRTPSTTSELAIDDRAEQLTTTATHERLDAELQRSLSAYRDPWLEGREPATANQFRTLLAT